MPGEAARLEWRADDQEHSGVHPRGAARGVVAELPQWRRAIEDAIYLGLHHAEGDVSELDRGRTLLCRRDRGGLREDVGGRRCGAGLHGRNTKGKFQFDTCPGRQRSCLHELLPGFRRLLLPDGNLVLREPTEEAPVADGRVCRSVPEKGSAAPELVSEQLDVMLVRDTACIIGTAGTRTTRHLKFSSILQPEHVEELAGRTFDLVPVETVQDRVRIDGYFIGFEIDRDRAPFNAIRIDASHQLPFGVVNAADCVDPVKLGALPQ
mmetsp:Transcript_35796/g.83541  ORF Transcript_35796/g.83541 Transcript_35796/m.83541 type:complete len:265 (+) Transcript_35796:2043-2837(+)